VPGEFKRGESGEKVGLLWSFGGEFENDKRKACRGAWNTDCVEVDTE